MCPKEVILNTSIRCKDEKTMLINYQPWLRSTKETDVMYKIKYRQWRGVYWLNGSPSVHGLCFIIKQGCSMLLSSFHVGKWLTFLNLFDDKTLTLLSLSWPVLTSAGGRFVHLICTDKYRTPDLYLSRLAFGPLSQRSYKFVLRIKTKIFMLYQIWLISR